MDKYRFPANSAPPTPKSKSILVKNGTETNFYRDKSHIIDSKDTELLSNAVVSIKEDISILKHPREEAKPTRKCPFEVYFEKCTRLEKENKEVKKKLKKMESYSIDCKAELQTFVKCFKEFKDINKDLDSKNKQLRIKNKLMRQRITEVLKQNKPEFESLEKITICEQQRSQQPREKAVLIESSRESQKRNSDVERIHYLQQENKTLRARLEHDRQAMMIAVSQSERVQKETEELESCLLTVKTERNLLQEEVKRLHKEYISLIDSISKHLKRGNSFGLLNKCPGCTLPTLPMYPGGADL